MKKYMYKGTSYTTFSQIRTLFPTISFPPAPTADDINPYGITIIEEEEPVYTPTQEEIIAGYIDMVQAYLDSTAQTRNYDNILSLCTYATSTVEKFRREGQAGVEWRDAVWAKCYEILADIQAGTRGVPEDIISELPVFTWGD